MKLGPYELNTIILGDCLEVMGPIPDNSVDSIVTDSPYGLSKEPDTVEVLSHWLNGDDYTHRGGGFMGKSWDSFVPGPAVWRECYRVLKPGGCLMANGRQFLLIENDPIYHRIAEKRIEQAMKEPHQLKLL